MPFQRTKVRALDRDVYRLGLACNFGVDERAFERGLERGMEYVYWTTRRTGDAAPSLKRALAKDRAKIVLAATTTIGWFGGSVRRACEAQLKELGTDYVDVFILGWVGRGALWTEGVVATLRKLKEEGKIRAIGISIHDRKRAAELAQTEPIELFMLRYNAAHPGAERDIFPKLPDPRQSICAYTATSWRRLLRPPRGWTGPTMTAGDCYRFQLSSPFVDLALTGPSSVEQLDANLDAFEKGPLTAEEDAWIREYGAKVHG
jgi:aryl-alcohol dehydrogenase-like predicted oxidoreductase